MNETELDFRKPRLKNFSVLLKLKEFRISIGFFFVHDLGRLVGGLVVTFMRIDDRCFLPFLSIEYLYTIFFFHMLITPIILEEKENFLLNSLKHNNKEK